MKIGIYYIDTVTPKDENEYHEFCDIMGTSTLRYSNAPFLGKFSHSITKKELKKLNRVSMRYYDREKKEWIDGELLTGYEKKLFAII